MLSSSSEYSKSDYDAKLAMLVEKEGEMDSLLLE